MVNKHNLRLQELANCVIVTIGIIIYNNPCKI